MGLQAPNGVKRVQIQLDFSITLKYLDNVNLKFLHILLVTLGTVTFIFLSAKFCRIETFPKVGETVLEGVTESLWSALQDSILYLPTGYNGIRIVDVSDSRTPKEIGKFPTTGYTRQVAITGDALCVADDFLCFLDVSNPKQPTLKSCFQGPEIIRFVETRGDFVRATCSNGQHLYFELTDIVNPRVLIANDTTNWYVPDSVVDTICTCTNEGLVIIRQSKSLRPEVLGKLKFRWGCEGLAQFGTVCIGLSYGSMQVIDISKPEFPKRIAEYRDLKKFDPFEIYSYGRYGLVCTHLAGILIIDVIDPQRIKVVGKLIDGLQVGEERLLVYHLCVVEDSSVYVAAGNRILIYDVSNYAQ